MAVSIASKDCLKKHLWPLTGYEADKLLQSYAIFLVKHQEKYTWHRFPQSPSPDLLIVQSRYGEYNTPEGFFIADGKVAKTNVYTKRNFVTLAQVNAACRPLTAVVICYKLPSIKLSTRTMIAVLKAAIDPTNQHKILAVESRIMCKRLKILPRPDLLLKQIKGSTVKTSWNTRSTTDDILLDMDIVDVLYFWPNSIARREIHFYRGVAHIPLGFLLDSLPQLMLKYLLRLTTHESLRRWMENDTGSPEHDFTKRMKEAVIVRKRNLSQSVINNSTYPQCIKDLMASGEQTPWKNAERYQLAYVLGSLGDIKSALPLDLAEPFIQFMQDSGMGANRIREFKAQLKPKYIDKRLCRHRASLVSGIRCPYQGGLEGVKACLKKRKGIFIDPQTATIATIWAFSDTV